MDDLEDIKVEIRPVNENRQNSIIPNIIKKSRIRPTKEQTKIVPGTQSIWFKTYGCGHNTYDGEYMMGMLNEYGYNLVESKEEAECWVLNSCTVKDPSQSAFMHLVDKAKEEGKGLVVSGCVPQADRKIKGLEDVSIVGIQQIDRIVEVVEETIEVFYFFL